MHSKKAQNRAPLIIRYAADTPIFNLGYKPQNMCSFRP